MPRCSTCRANSKSTAANPSMSVTVGTGPRVRGEAPAVSRSACRAAYQPGMPVTPGPGRRRRRREVHAAHRRAPRRRARRPAGGSPATKVNAPPRMSPPMSDGLNATRSAAVIACEARMRSRNPGANRSTCRVTSSVGSSVGVRRARERTPTARSCRRAPGSDRARTAAPRGRRGGPSRFLARRRSRSPRPRRASRRDGRWGSGRHPGCAHGIGPSSAKSTFAAAAP